MAQALSQTVLKTLNKKLRDAAQNEHLTILLKSYVKGAEVDGQDSLGNTALVIAVDDGKEKSTKLLLALKAGTNIANDQGIDAMRQADFRKNQGAAGPKIHTLVKDAANGIHPNLKDTLAEFGIDKVLSDEVLAEFTKRTLPPARKQMDTLPGTGSSYTPVEKKSETVVEPQEQLGPKKPSVKDKLAPKGSAHEQLMRDMNRPLPGRRAQEFIVPKKPGGDGGKGR